MKKAFGKGDWPFWVHPGMLTGFGGKDKAMPVNLDAKQWPLFKDLVRVSVCIRMSAGNTGAGVIISSSGLVITAWHVLKRNGRPYVHRFRLNRKRKQIIINKTGDRADLIHFDEKADIAVIKMRHPPKTLEAAALGDSNIQPATALYRVGVDDGTPLASGYLMKFSKYERLDQMELSMPARGGASGGPVFNETGEVVGIVLRAVFDSVQPSCCDAIPINLVKQRLRWRRVIKNQLGEDNDLFG